MKILHVSIGRAPFYTGGSVKYAEELMRHQTQIGDEVTMLFPGHSAFLSKTKIERLSSKDEIEVYEIINPLPISLLNSIGDPKRYTEKEPALAYDVFLRNLLPDVIHVHSIMGIHLSFFTSAKALGIPMVFTTHDYFPICVRCTLVDSTHRLCTDHTPSKCAACNLNAGLPPHWERLIRSTMYRKLKHSSLFKQLRLLARSKIRTSPPSSSLSSDRNTTLTQNPKLPPLNLTGLDPVRVNDFELLLNQNAKIMASFTVIHCNSALSRSVYASYFPKLKTITKVITHDAMPKHGKTRDDFNNEFRIGYLGGRSEEKGLYTLLDAFNALPKETMTWKLVLWGDDYGSINNPPTIENKGRFTQKDSDQVFSSMDILVVPSLWYETFGFVVLEALSYGIPVLCSDRVGAGMLLSDFKDSLIYPAENSHELSTKIQNLSNENRYKEIVEDLQPMDRDFSFEKHAKEIQSIYLAVTKDTQ